MRDILERRVDDATVPAWCETRGWSPFLRALDEATGAPRARPTGSPALLPSLPNAPPDLLALARDATSVSELPRVAGGAELAREALRSVRLRKRAQLSGLLAAVSGMAEAAADASWTSAPAAGTSRGSPPSFFKRDGLGLERNPERVAAAQRRSAAQPREFVAVDAVGSLQLGARDLAIGLHACGELGRLARARPPPRRLRSGARLVLPAENFRPDADAAVAAGVELRREHLGLTNLTAQPQGVEASIDVTIAARQTRYALGQLLRARGVELEPGAEMSGINRRRANAGLARRRRARAFAARVSPPAGRRRARALTRRWRPRDYALIRRLSLPRSMLARLVEVLVSLDRAAHLEERGLQVRGRDAVRSRGFSEKYRHFCQPLSRSDYRRREACRPRVSFRAPPMSDRKYAEAGVDYSKIDPSKLLAQELAAKTAQHLGRLNLEEIASQPRASRRTCSRWAPSRSRS